MTTISIRLLDPLTGERVSRSFTVIGTRAGYVYDTTDAQGTSGIQMCERLAQVGNTLSCRDDEVSLHSLILREQRRRLRAWRREVAR